MSNLSWLGRSLAQAAILVASVIGCLVLVGAAQRLGWIQVAGETNATSAEHDHAIESAFTCPMHPQIRQDEPGECPICGMKLVPTSGETKTKPTSEPEKSNGRYICPMMCTPPSTEPGRCPVCAMELVKATGGGGGDGRSITLEPAARRLAGIRTEAAQLGPVSQTIRTVGSIDFDESKLATISAYVSGRIEKLYADYIGVPVAENDDLAKIYSPDLYASQVEYLSATETDAPSRLGRSANLAELAKDKLIELGLTEEQVDELRSRGRADSRIRIRSPIRGTVIDKFAVEGDYIETGDKLYRIADLSTVWLMLDLYPDDAARIRFGQRVETEVNSIVGDVHVGRVAFISPTVDATTRTVQVRVEILNPDGSLKPGDYATARVFVPAIRQEQIYDPVLANKYISPMHPQVIRDQPGACPLCGMDLIPTSDLGYASTPLPEQEVVTVPRNAVLMTGENSVVYVETDPGRFEIRRVAVGPITDDRAVILNGIEADEMVATNGNFLIDSQMQLAGNPSLMDPSKAEEN
nr:efflux RND transporter periplasmic adaptor subunit [Allorhodopirellula solitaria]